MTIYIFSAKLHISQPPLTLFDLSWPVVIPDGPNFIGDWKCQMELQLSDVFRFLTRWRHKSRQASSLIKLLDTGSHEMALEFVAEYDFVKKMQNFQ